MAAQLFSGPMTSRARQPRGAAWLAARPLLATGLLLLCVVVGAAVFAPWLAPHSPLTQARGDAPLPPSTHFPLGTDSLGRDLLSRLLFGARYSLAIGGCATLVALAIGLLVGLPAGYFGGMVDGALMRLVDVVMAFPSILLAVALAAVLPYRNLGTVLLVIGLVNWTTVARVVRGETLALREQAFVEAARALGAGPGRVLLRHIAPHLAPTLLTVASLSAGTAILLDAGLSYLGMGLPQPTPSWGDMLREAQRWYRAAPWLAVWPGVAVLITVGGLNMIAFDLQRRRR
ncbi:MAG: ABC transporter permease [Armatimonadetes bacterium]|nr:ABC transporter permease [Armatimonadota bacterium]